jgi:hypothetical protein
VANLVYASNLNNRRAVSDNTYWRAAVSGNRCQTCPQGSYFVGHENVQYAFSAIHESNCQLLAQINY